MEQILKIQPCAQQISKSFFTAENIFILLGVAAAAYFGYTVYKGLTKKDDPTPPPSPRPSLTVEEKEDEFSHKSLKTLIREEDGICTAVDERVNTQLMNSRLREIATYRKEKEEAKEEQERALMQDEDWLSSEVETELKYKSSEEYLEQIDRARRLREAQDKFFSSYANQQYLKYEKVTSEIMSENCLIKRSPFEAQEIIDKYAEQEIRENIPRIENLADLYAARILKFEEENGREPDEKELKVIFRSTPESLKMQEEIRTSPLEVIRGKIENAMKPEGYKPDPKMMERFNQGKLPQTAPQSLQPASTAQYEDKLINFKRAQEEFLLEMREKCGTEYVDECRERWTEYEFDHDRLTEMFKDYHTSRYIVDLIDHLERRFDLI